ncbi:sugar ABC transporter substrate-binding protein, partial [Bacilli bacterium]
KSAGIPVILLDRSVDPSLAKAGDDYVTFIGSNFIEEGQRIGEWLVANAKGKTKIIELEGTTGSSPANDRKKGFDDVIAKHSDFSIVASQTGDFARDKGRQVAETLLQAHPDANV